MPGSGSKLTIVRNRGYCGDITSVVEFEKWARNGYSDRDS